MNTDKRNFQLSAKKRELLSALLVKEGIKTSPVKTINRRQKNDLTPLSFAQTRLWFLDRLEPGNPVYNETTTICISGELNIDALQQSINEIVRRHEALRTTFISLDGQLIQKIQPAIAIPLDIEDLQKFPANERENQASIFVAAEAKLPFNLETGPLLRATLIRLDDRSHWLLLTMHHIVCDAWSMNIFFQEMAALYEAFSTGKTSPLTELPIQYADYAVWQRESLQAEVLDSQLKYWKQKLSGNLTTLQLPTDRTRPPIQTYQGASQSLLLSEKLTANLKTLSQQQGVSLFMTLLAGFKTLLYRYSGQEDIILGSPIAGRNRTETENLIGFFLNTLVLRTNLSGNPSFKELLDRVRQVTLEAYAHQDLPFEKLVEELQPKRDLSRNPLFDVMINFINTPARTLTLPGLTLNFLERREPESKFDLTLYIEERADRLHLQLVYQRELFECDRMTYLLDQLQFLLEQIVADPNKPIESYSLVTPTQAFLLPDPANVLAEPKYEPIGNTFLSSASIMLSRPAVCQGDRNWTYHQLAETAQTIAQILLAKNSQTQEVVAVFGSRSFGLIASMMSVLLSGKILLTIDPNLPRQRQRLMLEQAKAKYLIYVGDWRTEDEWMQHELSLNVINIDSDRSLSQPTPPINLPEIAPDDAAYIFFTSGTTGVPKAVLGCHKGLAHFLTWQRQTFQVGPQDRTAQLTGLSFDVVLRDIFLPLTSGATLCLPEESDDHTAARILPWLDRQNISLLHTVPSLAQSWLADIPEKVSLRTLRRVFFAGEPLTQTLVRHWREAFPAAGEIVNLYGPTETTLAKCFYRVPADAISGTQPVGQPLPETQALVLSANNQLCGIGEAGQIVIRTFFRSLGYLNASEEHQRRFVKNPFRDDAKDLLYYTGDRGRYRPDGSLEILGRIDRQVKIRGVRIELGEIEAVLSQLPSVRQAAVIVREDIPGDKRLVAYIVPELEMLGKRSAVESQIPDPKQAIIGELRRFLKQQLPDAMIPSAFAILESLPLTPNGKVDRQALPVPDLLKSEQEETFFAPRDELEIKLTKIWEKVLGIQPIGIKDNFFDLGGHSLLALRLFTQIEQELSQNLRVATIFQASTIEQQANLIRNVGWSGTWSSLVALQTNGSKPPFFCVTAAGCTALGLMDLARHLGSEQPFYALEEKGVDDSKVHIEDVAAQYIQEIRTVQPNGPYFIGGHSLGGKIAFEMAQQLYAQGQKVALLAIIDTRYDGYSVDSEKVTLTGRDRINKHLTQIVELQFSEKLTYIYTKVKKRLKREINSTNKKLHNFQQKNTKKLLKIACNFYLNNGYTLPETLQKFHQSEETEKAKLSTHQVRKAYQFQPYPGQITVFRALENSPKQYDNRLGWSKVASGGFEIHDVPGNHGTLKEEPHVMVLADKLKASLEKAQSANS